MTDKIFVISPDKDLHDILGDFKFQPGVSATLFKSEEELFRIYKGIETIRGEGAVQEKRLTVLDADSCHMLSELRKFYNADDGHIIRSLLRKQLQRINEISSLSPI